MPADCAPKPRDATVTEPHLLLDTDVLIEVLCGNPKTGGTGLHTEVSGDTGYSAATDSRDGDIEHEEFWREMEADIP